MSYILEALKKAEAKRSENRPLTFLGYSDTPRRNRSMAYFSALALVVGLASASWLWIAFGTHLSTDLLITKSAQEIPNLKPYPPSPSPVKAGDRLPTKVHVSLLELPRLDRDQFPHLTFSQHIYSEHADLRAVVVNGVRQSEGDVIATGVRLEAVTQTGVVMEYRQYLIEIDVF